MSALQGLPVPAIWDFPLWPESASTAAQSVDRICLGLLALSALFIAIICGAMLYFAIRYRSGSRAAHARPILKQLRYELLWIAVPTVLMLGLFVWAAFVYWGVLQAPNEAMPVYVVGKQWMWKLQHPSGQREINTLHLPRGHPVKLILTSQDVIHSFYVPAFRVKMDALPGRYTTLWFEPTREGTYHIFCAEYCGADHSRMVGQVVVMDPKDYQHWLLEKPPADGMAAEGRQVLNRFGCTQCHHPTTHGSAPELAGLLGRQVLLDTGERIVADEEYLRESIVEPAARVVKGYQPIMPTYQAILTPEQINQVVSAIVALKAEEGANDSQRTSEKRASGDDRK